MKSLWLTAFIALFLMACQESLEDRCEREAKDYTRKNCPAQFDSNIRLDSLTFERSTHTIHYHYTMTGMADSEAVMDRLDIAAVVKEELKNTTTMKVYKDYKYNFKYTYRSSKDKSRVWGEVLLTAKDY